MERVRSKGYTPEDGEYLIEILKVRFEKNMNRHKGMVWEGIKSRLEANPDKLSRLREMEKTGGEPDVVGYSEETDEYIFFDCSPESPTGRRSLCYDREAQDSRKENRPASNALGMAAALGITLLTVDQYRELQTLGSFDTKTSSWVITPSSIRALGGALFADFRYGQVFVYHNSAPSYYSSRGFRGSLRV